MKSDFDAILDECLVRLRTGERLDDCLAAYPVQAERLRPLLTTAAEVRALPIPRARAESVEAGKQRMLAALRAQHQPAQVDAQPVSSRQSTRYIARVRTGLWTTLFGKERTDMKLALRTLLAVVLVLVAGGVATVSAAANSLPGDPLYGVKQTWEQVQLTFTADAQARQQLEARLVEERREEVQALVQLRREAVVELQGRLEAVQAEQWLISGMAFRMTGETIVDGTPALGAIVQVTTRVQNDGTLIALRMRMHRPPAPLPTQPPGPLATPTPDHTRAPSHTPAPTWTLWHTPQHDATPWHTPWHDDTPWHTQEPQHTPEPEHTRGHDESPQHTPWHDESPGHTPWSGDDGHH